MRGRRAVGLVTFACTLVLSSGPMAGEEVAEDASRLTDEVLPLAVDTMPERPRPLIELGNDFLGTGTLWPGFRLPTGAWWQPALIAFGTARLAGQTVAGDVEDATELRARLDVNFNLQLSGTERMVVSFRPLDEDGRFTRYVIDGDETGFTDEVDGELEAIFFEGDFGEIFPRLSIDDSRATDLGFSVGMQPLVFQEGLLIQDSLVSLGVTRNALQPRGTSNLRITGLLGAGEVDRQGTTQKDGTLFGILTSTDVRRSTIDADLVYLEAGREDPFGDQVAGGVSFVQRIGRFGSTFRVLGSTGVGEGSLGDGALVTGELSWVPAHTEDHAYATTFVALGEYAPAVRRSGTGGVLSQAGIAFSGAGLGFPGALDSSSTDVAAVALGYQKFGPETRRQIIFELAGRVGLEAAIGDQAAAAVQWQQALRRRFVLVADGFLAWRGSTPGSEDGTTYGGRLELVTKF